MNNLIVLFWAFIIANVALHVTANRLFLGTNAVQNQFPYVAFIYPYFLEGTLKCTATMLSNEWFVTAAHCLYYGSEQALKVMVCVTNVNFDSAGSCFVAKQQIIHKDFNRENYALDVALLQTPYIPFGLNVKKISLPLRSMAEDLIDYTPPTKESYENQQVRVAGWGHKDDINGYTDVLQWTNFNIISNAVCSQRFGDAVNITEQHICVDASNAGICAGDSGGPMIYNETLIGITSSKLERNCGVGLPVLFTRITSCLGWIYSNCEL